MSKIRFAVAAALMLACVSATKADSISFFPNSVAGDVTGDLSASSVFTLAQVTTIGGTGIFGGGNGITFPSITFNDAIPGGLTFSDAAFGSFTSTSVSILSPYASNGSGAGFSATESWTIVGNFSNGTSTSAAANPVTITLSLNQAGASPGALSGSFTMSGGPAGAAVPEPSSVVLVGLGLASVAATRLRRKKSA